MTLLLAIDTAATLCAACVYDAKADAELGRAVHDIGKGHAERLMATIDEALKRAGKAYADLDRIAVSIGPGSFTGVRVGVAAARGLALALKIPAVGVSTLAAIAAEARAAFPGRAVLSVIDGRRGDLYCAAFAGDGSVEREPAALFVSAALDLAKRHHAVLAGSGADMVLAADGDERGFEVATRAATADIAVYARLAAARRPPFGRPKPLYLRGADAKPQAGYALPRAGR